jgi:hypothetical protein
MGIHRKRAARRAELSEENPNADFNKQFGAKIDPPTVHAA